MNERNLESQWMIRDKEKRNFLGICIGWGKPKRIIKYCKNSALMYAKL